ncbi:hypothetical protein EHQ27_15070 [Leptospira wolffii]|uniref:hypothetical protein n=1 Tax=Leptospira wolffii TaxID=409998 RepID=UPI001083BF1F|nr:hypothetical protein [Leptospira wolffii]TGK62801.1 hypothetical protein EHQ32_08360 [Leptospira wolffii]TGK67663.1 hypothetical protein EHQ27_15070 [Leptospira wolffii]TGK73812.1 hypothetical protein EHQ35_05405 [Leptospira wolffii]TGL28674.1 hypothetical protein EHQ57_11930 [Leptospira wolffii]
MNLNLKTLACVLSFAFLSLACADNAPTDSDKLLLSGLLNNANNGDIAIAGSWNQYACSAGSCPTSSIFAKFYASTQVAGDWFYYQENPPTCWTPGGCTTPEGSPFPDFYPANYQIISYDNGGGSYGVPYLVYKNKDYGTYSTVVWTENSGSVYLCDLFSGNVSTTAALTTLAARTDASCSSSCIKTATPATNGCNGSFAWYKIVRQ